MDTQNQNVPLAVDLDGTLVKTDLFFESTLVFLSKNPLRLLKMVYWFVIKGRAYLKMKINQNVVLDFRFLPFNQEVIDWLNQEKLKNRHMILITGSTQDQATQMALRLNLFKEVFGVNQSRRRLTGRNKARFLVQKYGKKNFDYIGNSLIDFHVWKEARKCIVVDSYPFMVSTLAKIFYSVQCVLLKNQSFSTSFKINILNFLKIIRKYKLLLLRGFIFIIPFYFHSFKNKIILNDELMLKGLLVISLYYMVAFILDQWKFLQKDRIDGKFNIFKIFHPYWGLVFPFLFFKALDTSYLTFVHYIASLFLIYFFLEVLRFVCFKWRYLYDVLIGILLFSISYYLVFFLY